MPPVFGPGVALADALEVARRGQRHRALAVAQREQRELDALEELLDHDRHLAEALLTSISSSAARASGSSPAITTPLPAASPSALITAG